MCWDWNNYSYSIKQKTGEYADINTEVGYKKIDSYIYSIIKNEFTKCLSNNLITTIAAACGRYKTDNGKILSGECSIPSFKRGMPIDIYKKGISLKYDSAASKWQVELKLLSRSGKAEYGISENMYFPIVVKDRSTGTVLERCYDNVYKITASKLVYDKGKLFLMLGFSFEKDSTYKPDDVTMGVYLGIDNAYSLALSNSYKVFTVEGGEIEKFRIQTEVIKRQLYSQQAVCGEGRIGHGRKVRMKPTEAINKKISNFRNTINHRYSRQIVDYAVEHKVKLIQIEDLTGVSEVFKFLKNWSYFDLQEKITYKAKTYGIEVVKIDCGFIPNRCSKCGEINPEHKCYEEKDFICPSCGYKAMSMRNASQNLAVEQIDNIIKEKVKGQKIGGDNGESKV